MKLCIDADGDPYEVCPFHQPYMDQTAVEDGTGVCGALREENGDMCLQCPETGPRGGYRGTRPFDCPFNEGDITVALVSKGTPSD